MVSGQQSTVCSPAAQIDPLSVVLVRQRVAIVNLINQERMAAEYREQLIVTVEDASNGLDVVSKELVAVHLSFP